jgi:hypothetical protein
MIASRAGETMPAIFFAIAETADGAGAQPNISPSAAQARSRDTNWPRHR